MNNTRLAFRLPVSLAAAGLMALGAMASVHAAGLGKDEYRSIKDRIKAEYNADKAACQKSTGNARDICVEEAKGKQKVALAENEYNYTGKANDRNKIAAARADADYAVAKERCDDKAGNDKTVCVKEAKAAQAKAKSDATMNKHAETGGKS